MPTASSDDGARPRPGETGVTSHDPAGVLPLGDPRLRQICFPVTDVSEPSFVADSQRLRAALQAFRAQHGFGRAIAAPQIGVLKRFIALDLGQGPFVIINPEITWASPETFTMWDDCMCFPDLLIRVRRCRSISVRHTDEQGVSREWARLDQDLSELLQHEIDHLDGVLAVDRALDQTAIISRAAFDADPETFRWQVDYVIGG
jgi:peptide deformylase